MPIRSRLWLTGGVVFILGLVLFFPARIAYHWFAPEAVRLASIEGSVWSGNAREASVGGVYLQNLAWRLRPTALLTGAIGFAIEARPSSGFIEGNVALGLTGTITASELTAAIPLQLLEEASRSPGLAGQLSVQLEKLKLDNGVPVAAEGTLEVANLVIPTVHRYSIGGYRAEFFTADSGITSSVEDVSGMFDLAGTLQVSADGSYEFLAKVAATDTAPANVRNQLRFLGSPDERGRHDMRLEGRL